MAVKLWKSCVDYTVQGTHIAECSSKTWFVLNLYKSSTGMTIYIMSDYLHLKSKPIYPYPLLWPVAETVFALSVARAAEPGRDRPEVKQ